MKYVLAAAAVFLVALLVVFYVGRDKPDDPKLKQLAELAELAERACLSNTQDAQGANLRISLKGITRQPEGDATVARTRDAVRGAAAALPDAVKKIENDDIRKCMEPWSEKIRALATGL
ncbi:MAG TPA: hypothetical protein VMN79_17870 [Casimicrobiaceae bacterium]|nr:hypothetical protein [Casimicrobiaceae bacterium]